MFMFVANFEKIKKIRKIMYAASKVDLPAKSNFFIHTFLNDYSWAYHKYITVSHFSLVVCFLVLSDLLLLD